ncbi:MAG: D-alanine--D-alanine ligase A [Chlamydiae bacterium]|nr:D-alanine--D-alanine ligase A [Chlamydiota bacterium]
MRVGVLFGGQSAEHEVSIQSAKSIIENLDPEKYSILPIGIDKQGSWHFFEYDRFRLSLEENRSPTFQKNDPHFPLMQRKHSSRDILFSPCVLRESLDLIFPALHGPHGEDGSVQGLLQLANLPFIGSETLSSALCMDKAIMKDRLKGAGLPVPQYIALHRTDYIDADEIINELKLPLFVKPANLGSSVGINKVHTREEFWPSVREAFLYDEQIIIEEYVEGREIECAVLGNFDPIVSLPGEIIPTHEFYSYEAKYLDDNGAEFKLPAELEPLEIKEIQELSVAAFKVLRCEGMARIDFFIRKNGEILINELNTIPGFTSISLYPKLWEISGIPYSELIDRLIDLAIERFNRKQKLENNLEFRYPLEYGN